jgi:hypothetical protein
MQTNKNYTEEKWQNFLSRYKNLPRMYKTIVKKMVCDQSGIAASTFANYLDGSRVPSSKLVDDALNILNFVEMKLINWKKENIKSEKQ